MVPARAHHNLQRHRRPPPLRLLPSPAPRDVAPAWECDQGVAVSVALSLNSRRSQSSIRRFS